MRDFFCATLLLMSCTVAHAQLPPPSKLCSALTSLGLGTQGPEPLRRSGPFDPPVDPQKVLLGEWVCSSGAVFFGQKPTRPPFGQSSISYMVHGNETSQVRLTLDVSSLGDRFARVERFTSAAVELFKAIGHEAPDSLKQGFQDLNPLQKAWGTLSPTIVDASFGHIELIPRDDGSIRMFIETKRN